MTYIYKYNTNLKKLAQANKRKSTDAELKLWRHFRNRQMLGHKFRRQYPVLNYILDFYCVEEKLCIELDGSQHLKSETDRTRTQKLESLGIQVLRFWDNDVLQNTDGVLEKIRIVLATDKPHPSPLLKGEGERLSL